jgi:hypothetical protein
MEPDTLNATLGPAMTMGYTAAKAIAANAR